jgi:hypothetical protein
MAREMDLTFSCLNCFIGVEKLDNIKKSHHALKPLIKIARARLGAYTSNLIQLNS